MSQSAVLDSHDRLAQLGRKLFEAVRRQEREADRPTQMSKDSAKDSDGSIADWLFGDSGSDDCGGGDGD